MKKIHRCLLTAFAILSSSFFAVPSTAQVGFTSDQAPILLMPGTVHEVSYVPQTLTLMLQTNVEFTATCNATWATIRQEGSKIIIDIEGNYEPASREATVTVKQVGGSLTRTMRLIQTREHLSDAITSTEDFQIFKDVACSELKDGTTQDDIDALTSPFVRNIAQQILDGTYDSKYRLAEYRCLLSPEILGREWGTGKNYDVCQGITGIMAQPGKLVVAVDGIPTGVSNVKLYVYTWTVPESKGVTSVSFNLKNGINLIPYSGTNNGTDGLVYVYYYSNTPEKYDPIKVHIMGGMQNGYVSNKMTNDEIETVLKNAKYPTVDFLGDRVHSVWEAEAVLKYSPGKYRQYINLLDSILGMIHKFVGLEKYNRVPENTSLAYVNYDYYMYQGGLGVSFKNDQQYRCCSVDRLMKSDQDAIWGLSHEWGHQMQLTPYFCWGGMAEITNNMNSSYNSLHMGYYSNNVHNELGSMREYFLTGDKKANTTSADRTNAYKDRSKYNWNAKMYAVFESMKDDVIAARADDEERALSFPEAYPPAYTGLYAPFEYFMNNGLPDYGPDVYEGLRQTNTRDDKYAILASAQNAVSGRWAEFQEKYPESCWVKDGYIRSSSTWRENSAPFIFNFVRLSSLTSGYNLYPYFEQIGFFRIIALQNNDYGVKYTCFTHEMVDEFRADMQALEDAGTLKHCDAAMVSDILSDKTLKQYKTPVIPN